MNGQRKIVIVYLTVFLIIMQSLCYSGMPLIAFAQENQKDISGRSYQTPTIDGKLDEYFWELDLDIAIPLVGEPNNRAKAGVLLDEEYLYIGVHVEDDDIINSGANNAWDDDSVELYIDPDLVKETYNENTAQLVFRVNDNEIHRPGNTIIPLEGIQFEIGMIDGGYELEVAIPRENLGKAEPPASLGMTIHINDKDVDDASAAANSILGLTPGGSDWRTSENWLEIKFGEDSGTEPVYKGNSLKLNDYDSTSGFAKRKLENPVYFKECLVNYDFMYKAPPSGQRNNGFHLWSSYNEATETYDGTRIFLTGTELTVQSTEDNGEVVNKSLDNIVLKQDTWNNITLYFKEDKTFEVFINGIQGKSGEQAIFTQMGDQVISAIGYLGDTSSATKNGSGYIDNIKVITDGEVIFEEDFDNGSESLEGWWLTGPTGLADPAINCPQNELESIFVESERETILVDGDRTKLKIEGAMTDGTKPIMRFAKVTVESSDPEVVEVQEEDGQFTLKAISKGTSQIDVSVNYFGTEKKASLSIEAADEIALDHIVILSDPDSNTIEKGTSSQLSVLGIMNDGSEKVIDNGQVTWKCEPEGIVEIKTEEDKTTLTPLALGEVTIYAQIEEDDREFNALSVFTVEERSGTVTEIGPQVQTIRSNMWDIGKNDKGRNVGYTVVAGLPAKFYVCDLETGDVIETYELKDEKGNFSQGAWEIKTVSDGTVYIGGYNQGILYSYSPKTHKFKAIGLPMSGYNPILLQICETERGTIFGGSTGTGSLYEYNPETNEFKNHGQLVQDADIIRGIAYDKDTKSLYAGVTGPNLKAYLIVYDVESGEKRDILPEKYANIGNIYDMKLVGKKLFCRQEIGGNVFVIDIETEELIEVTNADTGETGTDFLFSGRYVSDPSPYDENQVFFQYNKVLYYYDLEKDEYGSLDITLPGSAIRWNYAELSQAEFPGYSLIAQAANDERFYKYNLETGKVEAYRWDLSGEPVKINSTTKGPDGKIYSGGYVGGGAGSYDPLTGKHEYFYNVSQVEGLAPYGKDKLYLGCYSQALVLEYDLTKPWDRTVSPANPLFLFNLYKDDSIPGYALQDRPYTLLGMPEENKVAIATVPAVNYYGGALAFFNVETREREVFWNVIEDQSIVALVYKDGLLYGSTSVRPGYNTPARAEEAKLFIWDMKTNEVIYEEAPIPGKKDITALIEGPDGNLWGFANNTFFIFDIDTRKVIYQEETALPSMVVNWRDYSLLVGVDGNVYGSTAGGGQLFRIDAETKEIKVILDEAGPYLTQDDFGNLYFVRDDKLYRYSHDELFAAPKSIELAVSTSTIENGESLAIDASVILDKGRRIENMNLSGVKPVYTSTNSSVAEVEDGIIVAKSAGSTTIKATANLLGIDIASNEIEITVKPIGNDTEEPGETELSKSVKKVIKLIDDLPTLEKLELSDKGRVEAARKAYEKLEAEEKALVENIGVLEAAEERIKALEAASSETELSKSVKKVIKLIDELPTLEKLELSDKGKVEAARKAYEKLEAEEKALVGNIGVLEAAEERIAELEKAAKGDSQKPVDSSGSQDSDKKGLPKTGQSDRTYWYMSGLLLLLIGSVIITRSKK